MASHNFLITGASSGLGLALARATLQRGHKVIATARNVQKSAQTYPDIENQGGKWIHLDVDSPESEVIVRKTVEENNVDVLVNNAGYAIVGAIENISYIPASATFI